MATTNKDDPEVKDPEDSTGNSTKDPEVRDDEDSTKADIGKAGKQRAKVVKIEESPADDGDAFVSPDEKTAKAWTIPIGKVRPADADHKGDDDEVMTRKVDFDFVEKMEAERIQREERRKARAAKTALLNKVKMSPVLERMIEGEVEKRFQEKSLRKTKIQSARSYSSTLQRKMKTSKFVATMKDWRK